MFREERRRVEPLNLLQSCCRLSSTTISTEHHLHRSTERYEMGLACFLACSGCCFAKQMVEERCHAFLSRQDTSPPFRKARRHLSALSLQAQAQVFGIFDHRRCLCCAQSAADHRDDRPRDERPKMHKPSGGCLAPRFLPQASSSCRQPAFLLDARHRHQLRRPARRHGKSLCTSIRTAVCKPDCPQ